jgi:hypothetical protein
MKKELKVDAGIISWTLAAQLTNSSHEFLMEKAVSPGK